MATIRMLAWNIQVYGPTKYSNVNALNLLNFLGGVASLTRANMIAIYETFSSVADQVAFNINEALQLHVGGTWTYRVTQARPGGDREAYSFFWRTDRPFAVATDAMGQEVSGLATHEFPNNFSDTNGRRAAFVTLRTTDTNNYFTITGYHSPPNARAILGLRRLAEMPQLYNVANPPAMPAPVPARLLAGDYNLDVTVQPDFTWLTNPVPVAPPPAAPGQGAGCTAATNGDSETITTKRAVDNFGTDPTRWPKDQDDYIRNKAIDNIYWVSPTVAGAVGSLVDILQPMTRKDRLRPYAEPFRLKDDEGDPAFPNAGLIRSLASQLGSVGYAFVLYRNAISDHLPVLMEVTI